MRGSRRSFTREFKQEAVQLVVRQGLSVSEAAGRLGVSPNLIRKWKQAQEQGLAVASVRQPSALEAENARLRAENERLRMEREILKKVAPSKAWGRRMDHGVMT